VAAPHFVYIVECADGTLYTGWSNDVVRRVAKHNAGLGARYTRTRRPVQLIYVEVVENRRVAMQREIQIKCLSGFQCSQASAGDLDLRERDNSLQS